MKAKEVSVESRTLSKAVLSLWSSEQLACLSPSGREGLYPAPCQTSEEPPFFFFFYTHSLRQEPAAPIHLSRKPGKSPE